ncbi:phthiocerol/phthiodiolone dimycocerosyl transferase family protein [Streptomyces flaveus]|uniref:phthiocerol/phthiodiolone dimycocerosyl transferase family protein n=1 Tax=Streptomyces flaveus TaxID=66370 RepID=UPI0033188CD8
MAPDRRTGQKPSDPQSSGDRPELRRPRGGPAGEAHRRRRPAERGSARCATAPGPGRDVLPWRHLAGAGGGAAPPAVQHLPQTPDPDAALSIDAATLPQTQTATLRECARAEGTTVHGAVAAAALGAAAELNADWSTVPLRVHSPLSLRGLLPAPAEGMGNILAPATTAQVGKWSDPWEAARSFTDTLAPFRRKSALLQSLALWTGVLQSRPAPADMAGMLAAAPHELLLTNLGALPIGTSYGSLTLESLWGPSVLFGFEGEQTLGLSTLAGTLRILHTSFSPVPELLELTRERLLSAIGGTG